MSIPGVNLSLAEGQLPPAPANTDGVFAIIGAGLFGQNNQVQFIVGPATVPGLAGFGPGPEALAQVLANGSSSAYYIPGARTQYGWGGVAGNYGLSGVSYSRSAIPALTPNALLGIPTATIGQPFDASAANTGNGQVFFAPGSVPQLAGTMSQVTVAVTTPGALGTALATITFGVTPHTGVSLGTGTYADPGGSGVILDFATPINGTFGNGDTFQSLATPNDAYAVTITINSVTAQGYAYLNYSLDGGNTILATSAIPLGCVITETGATQPVLAIGGAWPTAGLSGGATGNALALFATTQQGTALGLTAQCTPAGGVMSTTTASTGIASVTTPIGTGAGISGAITATLTVGASGGGTAAGTGAGTPPVIAPFVAAGGYTSSTNTTNPNVVASGPGASATDVFTLTSPQTWIGNGGANPTIGEVIIDNNGVPYIVASSTNSTVTATYNFTGSPTSVKVVKSLGYASVAGTSHTFTIAASGVWSGGFIPSAGQLAVDDGGNTYVLDVGSTVHNAVTVGAVSGSPSLLAVYSLGGTCSATLSLVDSVNGTRNYVFTDAINGLPSTFTEATTGLVFAFNSGTHTFVNSAIYTETIQPPAIMTATVTENGTPVATTGLYINSSGNPSASNGTAITHHIPGVTGPTLVFAHSNTDLYSYSATTPSNTTTFSFYIYGPQYTLTPSESNGTLCGFNAQFGFGTYLANDTIAFNTNAPSVAPTDVVNALNALHAAQNVAYSMVHVFPSLNQTVSTVTPCALLATLASDMQSNLTAFAGEPNFYQTPGFISGPDNAATLSGSTPADFVTAFSPLALNLMSTSMGSDSIVSALTGRINLRNPAQAISSRLAATAPQIDPGLGSLPGLSNDNGVTTALATALQFNADRAMSTQFIPGQTGAYVITGVSLESPTGDYTLVELQRVIAKVYNAARLALAPYRNANVPTAAGGVIDPGYAKTMNSQIAAAINATCSTNYQGLSVTVSLTANVQSTRTLPVAISVVPFAYLQTINGTIGFIASIPVTT